MKSERIQQTNSDIAGFEEYGKFQIADTYYNEKYQEAANRFQDLFTTYPNGSYAEQARYWYANCLAMLGNQAAFVEENKIL